MVVYIDFMRCLLFTAAGYFRPLWKQLKCRFAGWKQTLMQSKSRHQSRLKKRQRYSQNTNRHMSKSYAFFIFRKILSTKKSVAIGRPQINKLSYALQAFLSFRHFSKGSFLSLRLYLPPKGPIPIIFLEGTPYQLFT